MVKKITRVTLITIGTVILFLVLTNPGMKRFKEFDPDQNVNYKRMVYQRRVSNYFIYSVYETSTDRYLGIAFNFFKMEE